MSPNVTLPEEEEGTDVDGAEREGGATKSDCHGQNWASLRLTVA